MFVRRITILLLIPSACAAARPAYSQNAGNVNAGSRSVVAVSADHAPALDGTLGDASWTDAATVADFHQREPFEKQPATEKTEVKILYDRRYLYFAVHCFDSEPRRIVATELRRDADYSVDDNFTILLSPNNDRRNGYTFTFNPLGTQFDALVSDEGRVEDPNWDGIWKSNARVTRDGWTATVAIPFSTLNFKTSDNVTVGINFRRFIRRKNEEDLWQSYLRIYGLERISQAGELTGLRGHDWMSLVDASYNSNLIQAEAYRSTVQPNFNPEVGFIERTDVVTNFVDLQLSPRPKHTGACASTTSRASTCASPTRAESCRRRSGRPPSARTSITALTPTATSSSSTTWGISSTASPPATPS